MWTICTKKAGVKKVNQRFKTLIEAILYGLDSVIDENTEIVTGKERRKVFIRKGQNMSTKVYIYKQE
jgi:hypothetical protein